MVSEWLVEDRFSERRWDGCVDWDEGGMGWDGVKARIWRMEVE